MLLGHAILEVLEHSASSNHLLHGVAAIIAQVQATNTFATEHDRFVYTMRVLQGGILGSGLVSTTW
jgi:hypothetical protein